MDMVAIITFCKTHKLADVLRLDESVVLKTALNETYKLLQYEMEPAYIANSVLTVLEITAQNAHSDDDAFYETICNSIMHLERALQLALEAMISDEKPIPIMVDTSPILDFITQHDLPRHMKLTQTTIQQILLRIISVEMALGRTPEEAAHFALLELDGEALTRHITSPTCHFGLASTFQDELEKAIVKAYK